MSLESGTFVQDLQQTNPPGTDKKKQGDDHLRLIKDVLKNTFPNATRAVRFARSRAVSATGNINSTDMNALVVADATAGAIVLTLPTLAAGDDGWMVTVVKVDASANTVTISGTINGASNLIVGTQYRSTTFLWSGSAWFAALSISAQAQVTTALLADLSVTTAKLVDVNVTTAKIALLNITSGLLADNSVTTAKVLDANVTNPKLAGPRRTTTRLLSGTAATYNVPANCKSLVVKFIGGGGGGGATLTNDGAVGGTTTFNGITAIGGGGGVRTGVLSVGGPGGTGGAGAASFRLNGSAGQNGQNGADFNVPGPTGAPGLFGMGAGVGTVGNGGNAAANTGAGGAGGAGTNTPGSGGSGEYVEIDIQTPAASYVYTVGPGGAGGAAGGNSGGNGGSGVIIVEEYY